MRIRRHIDPRDEKRCRIMRILQETPLISGVTSYCPTVVTSSADNYHAILPHLGPRPGGGGPDDLGAEVLGAHLEGPFISRLVHTHPSVCAVEGSRMGCLSETSCFGPTAASIGCLHWGMLVGLCGRKTPKFQASLIAKSVYFTTIESVWGKTDAVSYASTVERV